MHGRSLVAATVVLLGAGSALGWNDLVFDEDALEWRATHVVVARLVVESREIEVLESWKGDLRRGQRIALPTFSPFVRLKEKPLLAECKLSHATASGERAVFYLERKANGTLVTAAEAAVSVVWIEEGHAFAYGMGTPTQLVELDQDEIQLRAKLADADAKRDRIAGAATIADLGSRARTIVELVTDDSRSARRAATDVLGTCKAESVRAIEELLARKTLLERHPLLLRALHEVDTDAGLTAARRIAAEELARWKKIAPSLDPDFAKGIGVAGDAERDELQAHEARLAAAVFIIQGEIPGATILRDIETLWENPALASGAPLVLHALRGGGIPY